MNFISLLPAMNTGTTARYLFAEMYRHRANINCANINRGILRSQVSLLSNPNKSAQKVTSQ